MSKINNIKNLLIDFDKNLEVEIISPDNEITIFSRGYKKKIVDDYNIFTIPDKKIYDLYLDLCDKIKKYILDKNLVFERLGLYAYARPIKLKSNLFNLSLSPKNKTSFFALINISDNNIAYFKNEQAVVIKPSDIHIMNPDDYIKIEKDVDVFDIIYVSISSVDSLQNQLPNVWVPLK